MPELPDTAAPMEDPGRRFDRLARLVGPEGLKKLAKAHVMVVGCGGVGSWAAEMIARSAVGRITLIDFDTVCIRNFNRQLQALDGAIGKPKAQLLAERFRLINPQARIDGLNEFFSEASCGALMKDRPDFVIDAIDHVTSKCFLINYCRSNNIPLIVSTGSGGRLDPTQVRVTDLGLTRLDPLARAVRRILRGKYAFPRKGQFGVQAVCTLEQDRAPHNSVEATDCKAGCLCPQGENSLQSCTKKSVVLGTAGFVTGAFGLACASAAVAHICGDI
ncbi:MAG: tRNA threonylcarbamoyladenosine dehydratase [Elusimicrobia bacterium CG08_land_8_20_14_0_20_59_10]|nr:MAG: tRNA threonylcarbamoyladenosine dehydratase [Elusimicrobia bacterium CG08_land_8_20_14_0_20_59_10]